MQSKKCDILKFIKIVVFGKKNSIKHPKLTKYHQNLDMLGNMLLTINVETFFKKKCSKDWGYLEIRGFQGTCIFLCYQQFRL